LGLATKRLSIKENSESKGDAPGALGGGFGVVADWKQAVLLPALDETLLFEEACGGRKQEGV